MTLKQRFPPSHSLGLLDYHVNPKFTLTALSSRHQEAKYQGRMIVSSPMAQGLYGGNAGDRTKTSAAVEYKPNLKSGF